MRSELTAAQVAEQSSAGRSTVSLWGRQGRFPGARAEASPVGDYWLKPGSELKGFARPERGRTPKSKPEAAPGSDWRVVVKRKRAAQGGGKK